MSDIAERKTEVAGSPAGGPARRNGSWSHIRRGAIVFGQQREATVLVIVIALVIYFHVISSAFLTKPDIINISQIWAPLAIIAIGEVLLLICAEVDLSVGFIFLFAPFLMHYLMDFYGVPAIPAILICLLFGVFAGFVNGFITVVLGVPSFITTLGTGFVLLGLTLTTSNAYPASIPAGAEGIGHWFGTYAWSEIIWAVVLVAIFHVVLSRARWGLHTIAVGGNLLGAKEAGIHSARIVIGNFMITGVLGALVGLQEAFRVDTIDPSSGQYQPMFYAIAGAVIGGTLLTGGSGTILGAFLGTAVIAILQGGFTIIGISANPVFFIFGGAILVAMIANVQLARLRSAGRT